MVGLFIILCLTFGIMLLLFFVIFIWIIVPRIQSENMQTMKLISFATNPWLTNLTVEMPLPNGRSCFFVGNPKTSTLVLLLASQKYYEKNITDFLFTILPSYELFIDIGANEGYYSILAAKMLKNAKKHYRWLA